MPLRRATGFAVLTSLSTLVGSLLVGATAAPAEAVTRSLTTSYSCTASTAAGTFGPETASGTISVNLPRQIGVGTRLRARPITITVDIPEAMVDQMRDYNIDSFQGSSDDASYRLKRRGIPVVKRPINDLVLPETQVPATGGMTVVGTGTAAGYTFQRTGRWSVLVPKSFTANGTVHAAGPFPPAGNYNADISCTLASGAEARIATIRVVS